MVKLVQSTLRTWVFRVLDISLVNKLQGNQTTIYNDLFYLTYVIASFRQDPQVNILRP